MESALAYSVGMPYHYDGRYARQNVRRRSQCVRNELVLSEELKHGMTTNSGAYHIEIE